MEKSVTRDFYIQHFETDFRGNITIPVLGNFLLQMGGIHADILNIGIDSFFDKNITWVLSKFHFSFIRNITFNTKIKIETWVYSINKFTSIRLYRVMDDDGNILAKSSIEWMVMNLKSRRPVLLTELIKNLDAVLPETRDVPFPQKVETDMQPTFYKETRDVKYSDIDINRHLYSMRYLQFILDLYPMDHFDRMMLNTLDINFVAEVRYGQKMDFYLNQSPYFDTVEMLDADTKKVISKSKLTWKEL